MMTIAGYWEAFSKRVMPLDAVAAQRQDMRSAFYAGATALLALQADLAELSEPAAVAVLEGLHDEAAAFCAHLEGQ